MKRPKRTRHFVFIALVVLVAIELSLQAAGIVARWMMLNHSSPDGSFNGIRIITVGESTTAFGGSSSYPSQLEKILLKRFPGAPIQVINLGIPSVSTKDLVQKLPEAVKEYRPQMALLMMGINDPWALKSPDGFWSKVHSVLENIKIYKFIEISYLNLMRSQGATEAVSEVDSNGFPRLWKAPVRVHQKPDPALFLQGQKLFDEGQLDLAVKKFDDYLKSAQDSNDYFEVSSWLIGKIGWSESKGYLICRPWLEKAYQISPEKNVLIAWLLGIAYKRETPANLEKSSGVLREAIALGSLHGSIYFEYADNLIRQGCQQEALTILRQSRKTDDQSTPHLYRKLVESLTSESNAQELQEVKAEAIHRYPHIFESQEKFWQIAITAENFKKAHEILSQAGVLDFYVQYPNIQEEYLSGLIKVPESQRIYNSDNFKEALEKNSFDSLFTDRFADDFGHMTEKGAHILSKRVFERIKGPLMELFLKRSEFQFQTFQYEFDKTHFSIGEICPVEDGTNKLASFFVMTMNRENLKSPAPIYYVTETSSGQWTSTNTGFSSVHPRNCRIIDESHGRPKGLLVADHGTDEPPFLGAETLLLFWKADSGKVKFERAPASVFPRSLNFNFGVEVADFFHHQGEDIFQVNIARSASHFYRSTDQGYVQDDSVLPAGIVDQTKKFLAVRAFDYNQDGHIDLFLGGHGGKAGDEKFPKDVLLRNDGQGHLVLADLQTLPERLGGDEMSTVEAVTLRIDGSAYPGLLLLHHNIGFTRGYFDLLKNEEGQKFVRIPQDSWKNSSEKDNIWMARAIPFSRRSQESDDFLILRRRGGNSSINEEFANILEYGIDRKEVRPKSNFLGLPAPVVGGFKALSKDGALRIILVGYDGTIYSAIEKQP